jgi:23S rRNA (adenine2030-N6)-methyltransferase
VDEFLETIRALNPPETIAVELMIAGDTSPLKMKGCGLLVINPPWQFDAEAASAVEFLASTLAQAPGSAANVAWVAREKTR